MMNSAGNFEAFDLHRPGAAAQACFTVMVGTGMTPVMVISPASIPHENSSTPQNYANS